MNIGRWLLGCLAMIALAAGCSPPSTPPLGESAKQAVVFVDPPELTSNIGDRPVFAVNVLGTLDVKQANELIDSVVSQGVIRNIETGEVEHALEVEEVLHLHDNWLIKVRPSPPQVLAEWIDLVLPTEDDRASHVEFLDLTDGGSVRRLSTVRQEIVSAVYHCVGHDPYLELTWSEDLSPSLAMELNVFARDSQAHLFGAVVEVGETKSTVVRIADGNPAGDIELVIGSAHGDFHPRFASTEPGHRLRMWEDVLMEDDGRCARWKGRFEPWLMAR